MARKPKNQDKKRPADDAYAAKAHISGAGSVENQDITDTLEVNYMPYAMSVILSRAIPEIDGFKPSHRKLLYTMYLMGLLRGGRIKSANIVGRTMQLNPHGDQAIYETMVRLTRGNEALLHPFIDSKGNFGKAYSRNMAYAASRYTEAKLDPICAELFSDIDKETVDFVPNYDNTMTEPRLFPVTFPTVLVNNNTGIAVGMASNICSFNLSEVCDTTIALIRDNNHDVSETLIAPDFPGGGELLFDKIRLDEIYNTGRGGIRIRAKYTFDNRNRCIDITEIPPTTTSEAIIDKIIELCKDNKIREISDVRDETDKTGLKITIDLKKGADADALMKKLFAKTPLEDTLACNFNVLIGGTPMVLGVRDLLIEWIAFRTECVKRRTVFELNKAKARLHLLLGLKEILLDIDKAIRIIRNTENEADVVPNLMIGFGIDKIQAEYVAEIKLRHLNREYILKRLEDIDDLEKTTADMEDILAKPARVKKIIIKELEEVKKKYGRERRTKVIYNYDLGDSEPAADVPDYPCRLFFTRAGYFKKITPQSLRMSGEQKLKEGDEIILETDSSNTAELIIFTDKCNAYKTRASDYADSKASVLGDFLPALLEFEKDENPIYMAVTSDYSGYMLFFFANGKAAKVDMSAYATKTNRKRLIKAVSDKSETVACRYITEDREYLLRSNAGRLLLVNSAAISSKTTKNTQGVAVMTLKKNGYLASVEDYAEGSFKRPARYRTKNLPAAGATLAAEDRGEQLTF
ncbi:MAG: topoisomerase IV [Clostridia bacterium]|nr:topoisomerase IV [Clostridia bacterium]